MLCCRRLWCVRCLPACLACVCARTGLVAHRSHAHVDAVTPDLHTAILGASSAAAALLATLTPSGGAGDAVQPRHRVHPSVVAALQQLATSCGAASGDAGASSAVGFTANFGPLGADSADSSLVGDVATPDGAERGGAFFLVLPSW